MNPDQIWQMYTDGRIDAAIQAATEALLQTHEPEIQAALHAILAWCHYRRKQFDEALAEIAAAGEQNQRARECHVYVLAYSAAHANDAKLATMVAGMKGNINAANALVIRARTVGSTVDHESVWQMATDFSEGADVAGHEVTVANLLHNTARFFHDKARDRRDLKFALGLIEVALAHYGTVANWHHRAAASFWMSHILEKLTAIPQAFAAAVVSLQLWQSQCQVEQKTTPFLKNLQAGCDRVNVLAAALVDFSKRAYVG